MIPEQLMHRNHSSQPHQLLYLLEVLTSAVDTTKTIEKILEKLYSDNTLWSKEWDLYHWWIKSGVVERSTPVYLTQDSDS